MEAKKDVEQFAAPQLSLSPASLCHCHRFEKHLISGQVLLSSRFETAFGKSDRIISLEVEEVEDASKHKVHFCQH